MSPDIVIGTGGGRPWVRRVVFPSNSHKSKLLKKESTEPIKDQEYFYVRLTYKHWPDNDKYLVHFPALSFALLFARNNCSKDIPLTRVYMPYGLLVKTFIYEEK